MDPMDYNDEAELLAGSNYPRDTVRNTVSTTLCIGVLLGLV